MAWLSLSNVLIPSTSGGLQHPKLQYSAGHQDQNLQQEAVVTYFNFCNDSISVFDHAIHFSPSVFYFRSRHMVVSAAKKAVWHTSVLFTGTTNSLLSTPCISVTTKPISIKFTYFMPSMYTTLHTKFERNWCSSL